MRKDKGMARPMKHQYVLIGGFSSTERGSLKTVVLYEGNLFGERLIENMVVLPSRTNYATVELRARAIAAERGLTMGRKFDQDVWAGKQKCNASKCPCQNNS